MSSSVVGMGVRAFDGQFAVVTGASSGIGRAVADALAAQGAGVALVGRDTERLEVAKKAVEALGARAEIHSCDLSDDVQLRRLLETFTQAHERIDVLVHAAGIIYAAPVALATLADFDQQYRVNVRAPFVVTQGLLPLLTHAHGQVVFVNSSVGLRGKENVSIYAGTKHALKAFADSLRMEVNPLGVRVLSVYAGTTATPMQRTLHEAGSTPYVPEALLQPADIAASILQSLLLPRTAEITDLHIRPMTKPF
jgi:NADP-dependent 3-hydroxy acid dehydrogenase YdfG